MAAAQADDSTDCATLHGLLLRALAKSADTLSSTSADPSADPSAAGAPGQPGKKGKRGGGDGGGTLAAQLVPMLFAFVSPSAPRHGKRFRCGVRDWLGLLEKLGGGRGLPEAARIRGLLERLLGDAEPSLQKAAIACLRAFKLKFFGPYADRLERICSPDTMRDEMAAFDLSVGPADGTPPHIEAAHRAQFIPLLIQLLFPLLKKKCEFPQYRAARMCVPRSQS